MTNTFRPHGITQNIMLFYAVSFLWNFVIFAPIAAVFFARQTDSQFLSMLMYTVAGGTTMVLELPTSIIADAVGRRSALVLASIAGLISVACYAFSTGVWSLIAGSVFAGLGTALRSGVDVAMLYATVCTAGCEGSYKWIRGWHITALPLSTGLAALIGGYLAQFSLRLPFIASLVPAVALVVVTLFLREPQWGHGVARTEGHLRTASALLKHREFLLITSIGLLAWAIGFKALHPGLPILYEAVGLPLFAFGVVTMGAGMATSAGCISSHAVSSFLGEKRTLLAAMGVAVASWMVATMAHGLWIGVPMATLSYSIGIRVPVVDHILQRTIPDHIRATVLSLRNALFSGTTAIAAGGLGWLIETYGVRSAFQIMAAVMGAALVLIAMLPRREAIHLTERYV